MKLRRIFARHVASRAKRGDVSPAAMPTARERLVMSLPRLQPLRTPALWAGCALGIAASMTFAVLGVRDIARTQRIALDAGARRALAPIRVAPRPVVRPADFTVALGVPVAPSRFVASVEQSAAAAHVVLASVNVEDHGATASELGRRDISVSLKGGYGPTKQVLSEVLTRFTGVTVRLLRMRRDSGGAVLDSTVVFSIWSAPLSAAPGAEFASASTGGER